MFALFAHAYEYYCITVILFFPVSLCACVCDPKLQFLLDDSRPVVQSTATSARRRYKGVFSNRVHESMSMLGHVSKIKFLVREVAKKNIAISLA